jgi:RNA polymerase sigma-70 factor (ECF subfamily)
VSSSVTQAVLGEAPVFPGSSRGYVFPVRAQAQNGGDSAVMRDVADRSPAAFERLYDAHAGPAFSLALHMLRDRGRAEEVTQEAFLSVWRNGRLYDPGRGSVRTWVLGIVRHRAIDAMRREGRHAQRRGPSLDAGSPDAPPLEIEADERTEVEVARRFERRSMRAALDELPEDQRRAIELAYFGGMSQDEISEALEVPLGTIKGRMRLGLQKLRVRLHGTTGVHGD